MLDAPISPGAVLGSDKLEHEVCSSEPRSSAPDHSAQTILDQAVARADSLKLENLNVIVAEDFTEFVIEKHK